MKLLIRKISTFLIIFAITLAVPLFVYTNKVKAQMLDYGGFVYAIVPCTCSAGVWVMLVNPNPMNIDSTGPYLWSLTTPPLNDDLTLVYPFPTMSLLGQYTVNGEQCQITIGTGCITLPTRGTFSTVTGKGIQP